MNDFKIKIREQSDVQIIDLKGYLDAHTASEFEQTMQKLINEKKFNILVNCKNLSYISSAGLGVFMAYIEEVRKYKGDIKLANMPPKIYNVFDILGFPLIYEIYNNEEEALKKFLKKS
ncbi:MAG: hypothetical protein IGBAC_0954 [Ignavibacteriae bacterium]|nr:MAG: hypothetical protein IGBAC_0954 [Ignavibacteriota bacterium]